MADWGHLGYIILTERTRQGFTSARAFAPFAKLGYRTIEQMEAGRGPFAPRSLVKIEIAFNWEPGSCELVLDRKEPRIIVDPPLRRLHDLWALLSDEQRAALVVGVEALLG